VISTTYPGFDNAALRDRVAVLLEQDEIAADRTCDARTLLPGFDKDEAD
jgi:hypothetical protein